jgi:hypothetical protein
MYLVVELALRLHLHEVESGHQACRRPLGSPQRAIDRYLVVIAGRPKAVLQCEARRAQSCFGARGSLRSRLLQVHERRPLRQPTWLLQLGPGEGDQEGLLKLSIEVAREKKLAASRLRQDAHL